MSYIKEINKMTWSFSRLHLWENCPYAWYLKYIEERDDEQNYYAANGKLMHSVFEELLNGKITLEEASAMYDEGYEYIDVNTRYSTMENTYNKCMDYLCTVDQIDKKYEIVGVELKLSFKLEKYDFTGFVDCLLRNIDSGEIILVDHKSQDHFMKKNGTPLKNREDDFLAYRHQMYLYCKGLKVMYNIQVSKIVWHHFKDDGALTIIPYEKELEEETVNWALNTIQNIKKDKNFAEKKSYMMCSQLCGFRHNCEYLLEE